MVFLIDKSDSMPAQAVLTAEDYVRQALHAMGPDDQAAVIVFGGDALVERPMSRARELGAITSAPLTNATDIGQAVRLGLALYPPGAARRMVILSDGADTSGNASSLTEIARLAAASGVQIEVVPFLKKSGPEVLITNTSAPSHLRQGESFSLDITLQATQPGAAGVRVLEGSQVAYEGRYNLSSGSQTFSLPLKAGQPGFTRYRVQISSEKDQYYQNNEMDAYSQVEGPPKVLLVAPPPGEKMGFLAEVRPDESTALVNALKAANIQVEVAPPSRLPADLPGLAEYSSVILVDVPARELSDRQMQSIQSYVRDLGGGLVAVGGPTSYGVGGYFQTPLEETLPLEMQIKDQQRRPSLTMVFIIDHSGSMSETSGGTVKLELAKEAAIRSVKLLAPMDHVGVIAFDETASWVVPITDLSDPGRVINAIGSIRSGGGTDILGGVQAMARVLPSDDSKVKHVILLTDGGADPSGIPELVSSLNKQYGITLSTVGVGNDAAPYLEQLAQIGGGRYHFAANPASIPSIFTEETTLATRSYIIEEPFYPKLASSSPILSGIDKIPPLYGYVGTSAKSAAQTILVSDKKDPILAAWQYGLGKSVAFTSDASGRWAKDWVQWQSFPTFWAQVVRYTMGNLSASNLNVQVELQGKEARLQVDALQPSEAGSNLYLNGYSMKANVVGPDGKVTTTELQQVAPGRYEGSFQPVSQGAYLIRITGEPGSSGSQAAPLASTAGWVLSYSPEYRQLESNPDLLLQLASLTGGKIASGDPGQAFAHTLPSQQASRPISSWLLMLAALLLPLDIAVRRLIVTRSELRRGWEKLAAGLPKPGIASGKNEPARARSSRVSALFQAKERGRQNQTENSLPVEAPSPAERQRPLEEKKPARSAEQVPETRSESQPAPERQQPSPGSTASTLLAHKRSQKK